MVPLKRFLYLKRSRTRTSSAGTVSLDVTKDPMSGEAPPSLINMFHTVSEISKEKNE